MKVLLLSVIAACLLNYGTAVYAGSYVETTAAQFAEHGGVDNIDARFWTADVPGQGPLADGEIMLKMNWERVAELPDGPVSDLETYGDALYAVISTASGAPVYVNRSGDFEYLTDLMSGADYTSDVMARGMARLQHFARGESDRLYGTAGAGSTIVRVLHEAGDGFADAVDVTSIDTGIREVTALGEFTDLYGDGYLMVGARGGAAVNAVWFEGRNWGPGWNMAPHLGTDRIDLVTGHEGFCFVAARNANILARNKLMFGIRAADWGAPIAMLSSVAVPGEDNDVLVVGHSGRSAGNLVRYAIGRAFDQSSFATYAAETTPLGARLIETSEAAGLGGDVYVVGGTDGPSAAVFKYVADYDAWILELETDHAAEFFAAADFAAADGAAAALYVGGRAADGGGVIYRGRYAEKGSYQSAWRTLRDDGGRVNGDRLVVTGYLHGCDSIDVALETRGGSTETYTLVDDDVAVQQTGNRVSVSWPYRGDEAFAEFRYRVNLATTDDAYSPSIDAIQLDYHEHVEPAPLVEDAAGSAAASVLPEEEAVMENDDETTDGR